MSNPFKNIGKNLLYISGVGVLSLVIVKSIVRARRDAKFKPHALVGDEASSAQDYYDNLAQVKPGFPLPKKLDKDEEFSIVDAATTRKSKYEAGGVSAVTRRRGDRLGFLDRRNND